MNDHQAQALCNQGQHLSCLYQITQGKPDGTHETNNTALKCHDTNFEEKALTSQSGKETNFGRIFSSQGRFIVSRVINSMWPYYFLSKSYHNPWILASEDTW